MNETAVESSAKLVLDLNEKIRVLHVDDDSSFLKITKQCIEMEAPVQVDTAISVEEALKKLEKERYDVIVSDYQMPTKDGLEFLKELRENGNTTPFIMFTGKGREEVAIKAINLGANQYLNKMGETETVYAELAHSITELTKIKKEGEALRDSEEKYRTLVEQSLQGILVAQGTPPHLAFANVAMSKILGYAPEKLTSLSPEQTIALIHPEDRELLLGRFKDLLQGRPVPTDYEVRGIRKNGTVAWLELSSAKIEYNGQPAVQAAFIDITERKKAEETLRESEHRLRTYLDSIHTGILLVDAATHVILDANATAIRMFGGSKDQIVGSICHKFVCPAEKGHCPITDAGQNVDCSDRILTKANGETLPIIKTVVPALLGDRKVLIESFIDVTDRKKAEEELRESEERYRELFESIQDPVCIYVGKEGHLIDYNTAFKRFFGYTDEELKGKVFLYFVHPDDQAMVLQKYQTRYPAEEFPIVYEIRVTNKKGESIPLEISVSTYKRKGRVIGIEVVHRDITERKHYEENLSALNTHGRDLNMAKTMEEVYELTLDAAEKTLGFEFAAMFMVEGKTLRAVAHRGYFGNLSLELPLDGDKGITVRAASTGKPVLVQDISKDCAYVGVGLHMRSELAVPIKIGHRVLGVLNAEREKLNAFSEKDVTLLQILASHAATAISNLLQRREIEKRSNQLASLMKSSAEVIRTADLRRRLQTIAEAIREFGWRRVVISVRDENLEMRSPDDLVAVGITDEEREFLWKNRPPGHVIRERLGPDYERFKIGEFYYIPWNDPWVKEKYGYKTSVLSHLKSEEMVDWYPQDTVYAPLRLADGRIVGRLSMDDPVNGRRPTKETLMPLELFLHQAAVAIENAQLIQQLAHARAHAEAYAREIRESQQKFERLFVSNPEASVYTDSSFRILDINPRFRELFGYSLHEVKGRHIDDVMVPKDKMDEAKTLREEFMKGPIYRDTVRQRKDGTLVPVSISAAPIIVGDQPIGHVGLYKDITERKRYEERLSALNIYSRDLNMAESMEEIYRLTLDAMQKVLGFEYADFFMIDKSVLRIVDQRGYPEPFPLELPLDGSKKGICIEVVKTGNSVIVQDVRKNTDFVEGLPSVLSELAVPIRVGQKTFGVLNVESKKLNAFDEKDRALLEILASHAATAISNSEYAKNLEASATEIRESQQRFERLFIDNPEAAVHLDSSFHILNVNPRFMRLFGYSLDEIKGKHINDFIVPKDKMEEAVVFDERASKGEIYHEDTVRKRKDGSLVPVAFSAASIIVENQVKGHIAVYKDISQLKKAEEELRQTLEKLAKTNEKLRVIGGLTRHDVRNKLSTITGNAYLLKKQLAGNSKVLDKLGDMEKAVQQTVRILDFARAYEMLGAEELVYTDVEKTVNEAISLFASRNDIEVINDCHGLTALADSLLRQLFYNLIDNSLKYGQKTARIRLYYEKTGQDSLRLVYEDDGVGIPVAHKPKLFKEGYSTGGSTGHGLYLIKKMMEVYGWTIQETGEPSKGARFVMTIPKTNPSGKENYLE